MPLIHGRLMNRIILDWKERLLEYDGISGGVGGAQLAAPGRSMPIRKNQQALFNLYDKEKEEQGPGDIAQQPVQPQPATARAKPVPMGQPGAGKPATVPKVGGAAPAVPKPRSANPAASATATPASGSTAGARAVNTPPQPAPPKVGGAAAAAVTVKPPTIQTPKPTITAPDRITPGEVKPPRSAGTNPPGMAGASSTTVVGSKPRSQLPSGV